MSTDLSNWLQALGLEQYAAVFADNGVDLDALRLLTESDLQELGVLLGHRRKLLRAIAELNEGSATATRQAVPGESPEEPARAEGERRQLTVMFCDLVGSTALSKRLDPEELRDLLQAYQRTCGEIITRYEGHVAQYLGDGLMVYFGWPRAHEDDAARAIRAGLELTEAVARLPAPVSLSARVGIHTGLVVVGATGEGDASVPTAAVGATPNIAARVQSEAEPGRVVASEQTRILAAGLFDYTDLGPRSLKGVADALRLYAVTGARSAESLFEATRSETTLTPLVGREEEVGLLLRRWEQARRGEGQVVLIGGEPGIGKSRLTRALRERISHERHTALRYQCSPYHLNSALYPVIEQFERAAGFARSDSAEHKLDKLEALLSGTPAQAAEAAPLHAALLSLPLTRYPALNLSPQKQKEKTLEALVRQVEALAQAQPVLMIFEDAHWIDATSQEVLDLLVPRLQELAVMLIVTYRPEHVPRWSEQAHVTTLNLNRLSRRQGTELIARLTGGKALPAEVLDQILGHTDGVPLFVEELTKSVLESKLLREVDDRYLLDAPLPALAIPTTLRDSLIARLDRLAPIREIAQIGACIGREFAYELLTAVSPLKGQKLDEALEQLAGSGLVFKRGTPPDALYTFKHALVQDAAYDSLLKTRRAQLHARIAETLERDFADVTANEPEVLAHHFTQARLHARAVPYWVQAGQRALERVAPAEAVGHLDKALSTNQLIPPSVERDRQELNIRILLGTAHLTYRGWAATEIIQALRPARDLAVRLGEGDKLRSVLFFAYVHHQIRSEYPAVLEVVEQTYALARSRSDSNALLLAPYYEVQSACAMGDFEHARLAMDQMLAEYDVERHRHLVLTYGLDPKCDALVWAGYWLWALGYPDQAREAAEEQLELARLLRHPFNLCWSLTGGTHGLLLLGEASLVRQWVESAAEIARENAMSFVAEVMAPMFDGCALIEAGQHSEGYTSLAEGLRIWRGAGAMHTVPIALQMLARASIALQRFDDAKVHLDDALDVIERTGHRVCEAEVYRVRGELQRQRPPADTAAAEASFRKALKIATTQHAKGFELRAAMSLARLWQDQDKRRDAHDLLAPIYNWFTEGFETKDLKEARALLDELRA